MAFDTRYRPSKYGDVLGQEASVQVLRQLVKEGRGFHQSYVFCGQYGSGKTTTGRILARALLCSSPVGGNPCDTCQSCQTLLQGQTHECLVELDAATKSTKEDMLRITDDIQYSSFSGKRRIYLMDEAHRLSKSALDALLKPMEDCIPGTQDKQLVCIFCTTEPEKMQPTIFSRCAPAFVIKAATPEQIAGRLAWVCTQENLAYEHDALVTIAEVTECHVRDALKTLEGASVQGPVTVASVASYLGIKSNDMILDMLLAMGVDITAATRAASDLAESSSPTSVYERVADAALCAYRVHLGFGKVSRQWDPGKIKTLAEKGDKLLAVCSRFASPPKRPTNHTVLLDVVAAHNAIVHGVDSESVQVVRVIETVKPAATEKVSVSGSISVNANKNSPQSVVYVDPRAVGSGAAGRRPAPQDGKTSGGSALDPDVFRNLVSFHLRGLTGAAPG